MEAERRSIINGKPQRFLGEPSVGIRMVAAIKSLFTHYEAVKVYFYKKRNLLIKYKGNNYLWNWQHSFCDQTLYSHLRYFNWNLLKSLMICFLVFINKVRGTNIYKRICIIRDVWYYSIFFISSDIYPNIETYHSIF